MNKTNFIKEILNKYLIKKVILLNYSGYVYIQDDAIKFDQVDDLIKLKDYVIDQISIHRDNFIIDMITIINNEINYDVVIHKYNRLQYETNNLIDYSRMESWHRLLEKEVSTILINISDTYRHESQSDSIYTIFHIMTGKVMNEYNLRSDIVNIEDSRFLSLLLYFLTKDRYYYKLYKLIYNDTIGYIKNMKNDDKEKIVNMFKNGG